VVSELGRTLAFLLFAFTAAVHAHGQPLEPHYGPGRPWESVTAQPRRDVPVYIHPSFFAVKVLPPGTMQTAHAEAWFDIGRVAPFRCVIVGGPGQARIRFYGVPWGHAVLKGYAAYCYPSGDVYVALTHPSGAGWLNAHAVSLVKHEITAHGLGLNYHGPPDVAGAMNGQGYHLPVVYHGKNEWIDGKASNGERGLAGFTANEIRLLQGLGKGGPIFWRTQ
jgi:hypothetical protein